MRKNEKFTATQFFSSNQFKVKFFFSKTLIWRKIAKKNCGWGSKIQEFSHNCMLVFLTRKIFRENSKTRWFDGIFAKKMMKVNLQIWKIYVKLIHYVDCAFGIVLDNLSSGHLFHFDDFRVYPINWNFTNWLIWIYFNSQDETGEVNEAAQLIERYKVFDLWPCGQSELVIFGLNTTQESNSVKSSNDGLQPAMLKAEKAKKAPAIVQPDISQMTPFKV